MSTEKKIRGWHTIEFITEEIGESEVAQISTREGENWLDYAGIRTTMKNAAEDITNSKLFAAIKNKDGIIFDRILAEPGNGGRGWRETMYETEEEKPLPLREKTEFDKALNSLIESCLKVCQLIEKGDLS